LVTEGTGPGCGGERRAPPWLRGTRGAWLRAGSSGTPS